MWRWLIIQIFNDTDFQNWAKWEIPVHTICTGLGFKLKTTNKKQPLYRNGPSEFVNLRALFFPPTTNPLFCTLILSVQLSKWETTYQTTLAELWMTRGWCGDNPEGQQAQQDGRESVDWHFNIFTVDNMTQGQRYKTLNDGIFFYIQFFHLTLSSLKRLNTCALWFKCDVWHHETSTKSWNMSSAHEKLGRSTSLS